MQTLATLPFAPHSMDATFDSIVVCIQYILCILWVPKERSLCFDAESQVLRQVPYSDWSASVAAIRAPWTFPGPSGNIRRVPSTLAVVVVSRTFSESRGNIPQVL